MAAPVLLTKLSAPPPRPRIVPRRRLVDRIKEGVGGKLTLISAPPGFGKTTLVSEWIADHDAPTAWLSLDEGDGDPARFLTYLVAALRKADDSIGASAEGMLHHVQPSPPESVLTQLLNDISAHEGQIALVLDDYHRIDAPAIDDAVTFLLDHMPPRFHLVITTRQDPRLPLTRLRARGELTELRAADLRFTTGEAVEFLHEVMGLSLSGEDIQALETRTEGWIAGLQLAALSLQGREDVTGFIEDFAGDNRYIVDYLIDEVLARQPADVREFLLKTSILERMNGSLCDAVTGRDDSRRLLQALEQGNLFVVPLDQKRHWYRYHHLFADVLRAYRLDERPDEIPALHGTASAWHEREGDLSAAIHHAFAAGDAGRAADLIEQAAPALHRSRREATILGWLNALPGDVIRARPVLAVDYAGTILQTGGDLDTVENLLRDAEQWLDPAIHDGIRPAGMTVRDESEFRRLPGQIRIYRAGIALVRGDVAGTMSHAGEALDLLPEDDDFSRGAAAGLLGLAYWTSGDLETGHRMYSECLDRLRRAGFIADTFGCALALADIRIAQGRLHDAMATFERALSLPAELGLPALRGMADMHVSMSGLYRERNDRDAAARHLMASRDLGEHMGLPQNPYRWRVEMARVREVQGDVEVALNLLDEAQRVYVGDFFPDIHPIAAVKARVWISHGRLGDAIRWASQRGISVNDELSYLHEYEHVTLARILIARFRTERDEAAITDALGLLRRLLDAAEEGRRTGSVIEVLVLQALAHEASGDSAAALGPLEHALLLAEPEGYVRIFVDEGAPMHRLLTEASVRGITPDYTARLRSVFTDGAGEAKALPAVRLPSQPLPEPLSARELEVLRLIADGLSNQEIADRLYLALDTVKGHNRRLFAKLDVQRRTEAISRARELGLL